MAWWSCGQKTPRCGSLAGTVAATRDLSSTELMSSCPLPVQDHCSPISSIHSQELGDGGARCTTRFPNGHPGLAIAIPLYRARSVSSLLPAYLVQTGVSARHFPSGVLATRMIQAARCTAAPLRTTMSFLERNLRETTVRLVNDSNYSPEKIWRREWDSKRLFRADTLRSTRCRQP